MGYDVQGVRRLLADNNGNLNDLPSLARSVGQAEGGSVQSQHKAAQQFWEIALSLTTTTDEDGEGAPYLLPAGSQQRAFAEAEVARHAKALEPPPLARNHYGPPPDFKGQAV